MAMAMFQEMGMATEALPLVPMGSISMAKPELAPGHAEET